MKELQKVQHIQKITNCAACGAYQDTDSDFCTECGHSLMCMKTITLCPFCGEELTDTHLFFYCDADERYEILMETKNKQILYCDEGHFWMFEKWSDYDVRKGMLTPLDDANAVAIASVWLSDRRASYNEGAEQVDKIKRLAK